MGRKGSVVLGLLVAGALVGGLVGTRRTTIVTPGPPAVASTSAGSVIEVHVAGWVVRPGVVTVGDRSIVAEAIEAAGGMKPGARPDLINLAATIQPGEQVVVPGPESSGGIDLATGDGLVSLNGADASALEALPGVGPVLAERIVSFREQNGPFGQVEDLLQVPGIGEAKLASIREHVKVR